MKKRVIHSPPLRVSMKTRHLESAALPIRHDDVEAFPVNRLVRCIITHRINCSAQLDNHQK